MGSRSLFLLLFLLPLIHWSCKKDEDLHLAGVYRGTARVVETIPTDPGWDTLYTNVSFTIDKGSQSTRTKTTLTLDASPAVAGLSPEKNLPIQDGTINSRVSGNMDVLTWTGQISADSMILTSTYVWVSGGNRREIFIKARKQ